MKLPLLKPASGLPESSLEQAQEASPEDRHSLELVVTNAFGMHARAAAQFVQIASRFRSEILVEKEGARVDGKSLFGILTLAAGPGTCLTLHALGQDALQALAELRALVHQKFNED